MLPTFCGPMGIAGWQLMLLIWAGLIALVVWGVARLFPCRASEFLAQGLVGPDPRS